jgi:PKD repeat protein
MKKVFIYGLFASLFVCSCSKSDDTPSVAAVVADFTITVTGQAPNAQISIENKTTGATTYKWSFGAGANDSTSSIQSPKSIVVDKAGDLTIKLTASNGTDSKVVSKTVSIAGYNAVKAYTDIAFSLTKNNATIASFFSSSTGLSYKNAELTDVTGSNIDLAFVSMSGVVNYFVSPDDAAESFNIPSATTTLVKNYVRTEFSSTDFDNMVSDEKLKSITIVNDNESFGASMPQIVLFQNGKGKKGVIKVKSINSERILADIKVQKY